MRSYREYVDTILGAVQAARDLPTPSNTPPPPPPTEGPTVLLFSPHPDDECIIGTLPLRLQREAGFTVRNVPVTFGSNPERRAARADELARACGHLGWTLHARDDLAALTAADVAACLAAVQPDVVVMPHAQDWNARHIQTHHLVVESLGAQPAGFRCFVVETEFWGAMDDPNLMVAANADMVTTLVEATALHVGEVARNPYHLLLPAWMQDNVRRGAELVGGQGAAAPDFDFATLYRLRAWAGGAWQDVLPHGLAAGVGDTNWKELLTWK